MALDRLYQSAMRYDEHGWALDPVRPLPRVACYSLFAREGGSRFDEARLAQQAKRFFGCELRLLTPKAYPGGAEPRADEAELSLDGGRVRVRCCPIEAALALRSEAEAAARGGLEHLVAKATRVWQIEGDDALLAAAIFASVLLAPILAPDGALFGVKSARERLGRQ
jgi:hypothetical protein